MKRQDFFFELPDAQIARYPLPERTASRLLQLDGASGALRHGHFSDLADRLQAGDLLVVNDTRVLPARLLGQRPSGGRVEALLERCLQPDLARVYLKAGRGSRPGSRLLFAAVDGGGPTVAAEVVGRDDDLFLLRLCAPATDWFQVLATHGHMPLPPYLARAAEAADSQRYQTVYARAAGAVAAPTAGLHFDKALLDRLQAKGVRRASLTLHVGAGTFQPVRVDNIAEHRMHPEWIEVPAATVEAVQATRAAGGRVVAVGTTVVRALESASATGALAPYRDESRIFITPGYRFRSVDALITNFHLPESTLLMLVAAFAGRERVLAAYAEAIAAGYRFYSYGDAMFITPCPEAV